MDVEIFLTKLAIKHFIKVYRFDLNCVIEVQGQNHSGERSLNVERQVKLKWED